MNCPQCGLDATPNSTFCSHCGTRVGAATDPLTTLDAIAVDATRPPDTAVTSAPRATGAGPGVMLQPGAPFGPRYRILRQLGQGGMGVVYQAWDNELGLAVALKLIRPEVLSDPLASAEMERRFKRELVVARQVTHKHVVRIHDIGEVNGVKYLTMPFIEGHDLRTVIAREGHLPPARVVHLARQIASGLMAAHDVGVIHRDLKPENVMVNADESAVIMDFGLARSAEGASMTGKGAVMGTLTYMAPEQARGEKLDQRADIYALGLVLYDMLAGRRRLGAHGDAMSEMLARMREAPPSLPSVEPGVPQGLASVIARAIEPNRDARFQTVRELLEALDGLDSEGNAIRAQTQTGSPATPLATRPRWALASALAGLVASLAIAVWLSVGRDTASPAATPAREPVSVLIANFDNQTGDPLFDGSLEQALGLGIEGASFITAFPRRDAERAAQQIKPDARLDEATARLVCQREGIKTTLAGSIVKSGSGYEISVRLIDPVPGTELARASETVAGRDQALAAVSALAAKVRTALGDATPDSAMAAARETFTTASLEAAHDYAEAQTLANGNRDEEAVAAYQRAIQHDPQLGRAYAGWALSAFKLGRRDEAEQLYQKAFALVDRMTEREKFRTLGTYYLNIAGNYDKAIENYSMVVNKYPADGASHNNLALAYFNQLQFVRALQQGTNLLGIYPKSALYRYNQALYAMYAGEFSIAATEARRALEINPILPKAHLAIAMAAVSSGDMEAARAEYARAREAGPRGGSLAAIGLADLSMYEGRFDDAVALLDAGIADDEASRNATGAAAKTVALAEAHMGAGRMPQALQAVGRAQSLGRDASILVPAARIYLAAGRSADAAKLADQLDSSLATRSRAYARVIRALLQIERNQPVPAIDVLQEAQKLSDLWLVRFCKGVAYVGAGAYAEALSELELVEKRRGEATAVFLDDVPSYRYVVPVSYWLGRAHDGLGAREAAARHYKAYLSLRAPDTDALAKDAATRLK